MDFWKYIFIVSWKHDNILLLFLKNQYEQKYGFQKNNFPVSGKHFHCGPFKNE